MTCTSIPGSSLMMRPTSFSLPGMAEADSTTVSEGPSVTDYDPRTLR